MAQSETELVNLQNSRNVPTGGLAVVIAFLFICIQLAWPSWTRAETIQDADQLLAKDHFKDAEIAYRGLLDKDETGDAYAGLAVALSKQLRAVLLLQAERVLKIAKEKFADNPNVIAAGGYLAYEHSKFVRSPSKRRLYLEASKTLSARALKDNPGQPIAQQTVALIENLKELEEDQKLDKLESEWRAILEKEPNNLAASVGISQISIFKSKRVGLNPEDRDFKIEQLEFLGRMIKQKCRCSPKDATLNDKIRLLAPIFFQE